MARTVVVDGEDLVVHEYRMTRLVDGTVLTLNTTVEAADEESAINKMIHLARIVRGFKWKNDGLWTATVVA